jgi:hypothetical protein
LSVQCLRPSASLRAAGKKVYKPPKFKEAHDRTLDRVSRIPRISQK